MLALLVNVASRYEKMHEAQKNEKAFGFEIAAADAVTAIIAVSATNGMTPAR